MTKKILVVAALLAVLGVGSKAHATVAYSTPTWASQQLISAPPSGSQTVIKSIAVTNDSANDACVYLYSSATIDSSKANLRAVLCAKAGTTAFYGGGVPSGDTSTPGYKGAVTAFMGEILAFTTPVWVNTGVVDSSKLASFVAVSYEFQKLR